MGWEFSSSAYESLLIEASERMPPVAAPNFEPASVLRHCAEVLLRQTVGNMRLTQALEKQLANTWLLPACRPHLREPWLTAGDLTLGKQWATWRKQLSGASAETGFQLGLQLQDASFEQPDSWRLVDTAREAARQIAHAARGNCKKSGKHRQTKCIES